MKPEDILVELKGIYPQEKITKKDLMRILKKYAAIISVHDLMMASAYIRKDGEYVQSQYREKYLEIYIKYVILRMKEVLGNNSYDKDSSIDKISFNESFPMLKRTFEKERISSSDED